MRLPEPLVVHVAAPLRQPVVHCGKDRKDRAWHQYVVEVSNHKVGVVILEVSRRNRQHQTGEAADGKQNNEGDGEQHRRLESHRAPEHGGHPVKHLNACRHGDQHRRVHKEQLTGYRHPHGKHMVGPDDKREEGDRSGSVDHRGIAEQRLARKGRNDRRGNTEGRQDHNIHFRVAKEPEHVLEQHRITAASRAKEAGAEVNIHQHHGHTARQHRHYRNQQIGRNQPSPDEQRHFHQGHAGGAQVENSRDNIDRTHNRRGAHNVHGEDKVSHARRRVGGRQRGVESPAKVGRATLHQQRRGEQGEGKRQNPETPVIHPRQRHIRSADHHRNQPVGQTDESRHNRTKDHHQAVHGGHLVEKLRLDQLQAGLEQLSANYQREDAAEKEHGKAEPEVHAADIFMVGGI